MPIGEGPVRTREVYATVIEVLLRDGILTQEEQRLATRLAILLFKDDDLKTIPGEIYSSMVAGDVVDGGEIINKNERLQIYEEMFETAFLNASLSHDELAVIAILRSSLQITDKEHELAIEIVRGTLEESNDPKLLQKVRDDLAGVIELVGGMFESLRPKR